MKRRRLAVGVAVAVALGAGTAATALFGDSSAVGSNTFTTATLSPPTLDAAIADPVACTITLTWTAPASGPAPDGYDVYRAALAGGPYSFVKHVGVVTTTTDTGLTPVTTYHYVLRSTRSAWTSADSNERSATTAALCV